MYKIIFYQNTNGENEVLNHINYLNQHTNKDNTFLLLTYFIKKTQKTPAREIERAKKMLVKYLKEGD